MMNDIDLNRGRKQSLLPGDFLDIICNRYFPVLSLTYIGSAIGFAAKHTAATGQGIVAGIFYDPYPYDMAMWVALWVSIPALFWIILRGSIRFSHMAGAWYKAIAGMMIVTVLLSYVLFPEIPFGQQLRIFTVATIPVFFIQYLFFVRGGLPALASWPLTIAGIVLMLYGTFFI